MPQWSIDPSIPLLLDSSPGTRSRLMISMSSINAVLWMIAGAAVLLGTLRTQLVWRLLQNILGVFLDSVFVLHGHPARRELVHCWMVPGQSGHPLSNEVGDQVPCA